MLTPALFFVGCSGSSTPLPLRLQSVDGGADVDSDVDVDTDTDVDADSDSDTTIVDAGVDAGQLVDAGDASDVDAGELPCPCPDGHEPNACGGCDTYGYCPYDEDGGFIDPDLYRERGACLCEDDCTDICRCGWRSCVDGAVVCEGCAPDDYC